MTKVKTPPQGLEMEDDREVVFLRRAVKQLTRQLEEQTVLMDDMAAELRKKDAGGVKELARENKALKQQLSHVEAEVLEARLDAEGRYEQREDLARYTRGLEEQVLGLQAALDTEVRSREHHEEESRAAARPPDITEQLTSTISYLQKSLFASESKYMKDTAQRLAEMNLIRRELTPLTATMADLMGSLEMLATAAGGGVGVNGWATARQSLEPVEETSGKLIGNEYLQRLGQVAEDCLDPNGSVNVERLKVESDKIQTDLRSKHNLSFTSLQSTSRSVATALSLISTEFQTLCGIYGTQNRALHTLKQDLKARSETTAGLEAELDRITARFGAAVDSTAVLEETRKELDVVRDENKKIKLFMSRLKLSDLTDKASLANAISR